MPKNIACRDKEQNPIKGLESLKEKIQTKLNEGEMSQDKAEQIKEKIDEKISALNEFNNFTVQQKKDFLIQNFQQIMKQKVEENRINQEKANSLIEKYKQKVNNWDGNGYPKFIKRSLPH